MTEIEEKIVENFKEGNTIASISKELKIDRHKISDILRNLGYKTSRKLDISDSDKEYIISAYHNTTAKILSEQFKCSESAISAIWAKAGLKGKIARRYTLNENYFEKIDSANKAYFLGFLMADGCIYSRKTTKNKCQKWVRLSIHKKDIEVLEKFKEELKSNLPILIGKDDMASITIVSDIMADHLSKYGIVERKTWSSSIVTDLIPDEYLFSLLTGHFDGDGSIMVEKEKTHIPSAYSISIVGNYENMMIYSNILNLFNIENNVKEDNRIDKYNDKFFYLTVATNASNKYNFCMKYLNNQCFKLSRKKERFIMLAELIENNSTNRIENIRAVDEYYSNDMIWG